MALSRCFQSIECIFLGLRLKLCIVSLLSHLVKLPLPELDFLSQLLLDAIRLLALSFELLLELFLHLFYLSCGRL